MLLVQTAKSKKMKYSFKAQTKEEAHLWIKCINQFTENLEENMQIPEPEMDEIIEGQIHEVEHGSSDTKSHPRSQSVSVSKKKGKTDRLKFQELYKVFHSKLFVEDNDLNTKIQALTNIQEMFKHEKQSLIDLVNEEAERYDPIRKKLNAIDNISNTMAVFIGKVIEEVNESRGQMFEMLENMAFQEVQAEESKKKKKANKKGRPKKETNMSFTSRSKSISNRQGKNEPNLSFVDSMSAKDQQRSFLETK